MPLLKLSLDASHSVSHLVSTLRCPVPFSLLNAQGLCLSCAYDLGSLWGRNLYWVERKGTACLSIVRMAPALPQQPPLILGGDFQAAGCSLSSCHWNPPGGFCWCTAQLPEGSKRLALLHQALRARSLSSPKWWAPISQPFREQVWLMACVKTSRWWGHTCCSRNAEIIAQKVKL